MPLAIGFKDSVYEYLPTNPNADNRTIHWMLMCMVNERKFNHAYMRTNENLWMYITYIGDVGESVTSNTRSNAIKTENLPKEVRMIGLLYG